LVPAGGAQTEGGLTARDAAQFADLLEPRLLEHHRVAELVHLA